MNARIVRIAQDYNALREYATMLLKNPQATGIPDAYLKWLNHLLWLRRLKQVDRDVVVALSYEELVGLALVEEVSIELQLKGKECPNCHRMSVSALTCEHCGTRLPSQTE